VLRRLVVAALAGVLVLGVTPARAFAADDWRPQDDHYQCVWRCKERGWLFRSSPKGVGSKPAPAPKTGAAKKPTVVSQKGSVGQTPNPGDKKGFPPVVAGEPAGDDEPVPAGDEAEVGYRPRAGRGTGAGFGFFSWLTSLFGDRSWRTSRRSDPSPSQSWTGYRHDGWDRDDRWGLDDRWGWDDWHHGWNRRPRYRDNWSWDDGRGSGYTSHRHHPRGGDF
jgi:hypothetical protein